MKNGLLTIFSFTMIALNQGCSNNSQSSQQQLSPAKSNPHYHKIDFVSFINQRKNDSLDFYEELLSDKVFVNVMEHGEFYRNDVMTFLGKGNFNSMQVEICICAMQNLNVNDYVNLCNLILSFYNEDKLSEGVLEDAISPNFLHKRIITDNYNDPKVIKLLKSIENNKKVSNKNFREFLPDILSGKSSKELKEFDENNGSN
jgi:hypothetical protein